MAEQNTTREEVLKKADSLLEAYRQKIRALEIFRAVVAGLPSGQVIEKDDSLWELFQNG